MSSKFSVESIDETSRTTYYAFEIIVGDTSYLGTMCSSLSEQDCFPIDSITWTDEIPDDINSDDIIFALINVLNSR